MSDKLKENMSAGCRYENARLHMFTKRAVIFVEMTPSGPAAYCKKGASPGFTPCCLPEVYYEAMVDAAEDRNGSDVERAPEYPAGMRYPEYVKFSTPSKYLEEDVPGFKASETPAAQKRPRLSPDMCRSPEKLYQSHIKAQFDFFRENFDHSLLKKASVYYSHRLDIYRLLMLDGGIELAESNPALTFMVALNRTFCAKKDAEPWGRAGSMLKMKRRKILSMCGFPESESLVRIFGRIGLENVSTTNIILIRKALKKNPELLRVFSFVDNFQGNVIKFATMPELSGAVTAQFLNEAGQVNEYPANSEYNHLLDDTVRMSSMLGESLGTLRNRKDLQRRHDDLIIPYTAKMKLGVANASFPEPPFDGTSVQDFEIHPVRSPETLYKWATRQHNYVMTRFASIAMAEAAVYMVTRPVEATLEVLRVRTGSGWRLGDLKGTCNTSVPGTVTEHVKRWFNERRGSPRQVETHNSVAGLTMPEIHTRFSRGLPVPDQYQYDPRVDDVLNENDMDRNTEFAQGPLPEYLDSEFSVKPVRRAGDMTEVLRGNQQPPEAYLELAKAGEYFVYIAGISDKHLVFLSVAKFPERKIEVEHIYPRSERILTLLRKWIENHISVNGFPLELKDDNQIEFSLE
ncbi:MAG: hypothetical protein WC637_22445 [Victivallales bacterium]